MRQRRSSPNPESTVPAPAQLPEPTQEPAKTRKPRVAKAALKESPSESLPIIVQQPMVAPSVPEPIALKKKAVSKSRPQKSGESPSQPELQLDSLKPAFIPSPEPVLPKPEAPQPASIAPLQAPKVTRPRKTPEKAITSTPEPVVKAEPAPQSTAAPILPAPKAEPAPQILTLEQAVRAELAFRAAKASEQSAPALKVAPAPIAVAPVQPVIKAEPPAPKVHTPEPMKAQAVHTEPAPAPAPPKVPAESLPKVEPAIQSTSPVTPAAVQPPPAAPQPFIPTASESAGESTQTHQERRPESAPAEVRPEGGQAPAQNVSSPHPHQQGHGNNNGRHQGHQNHQGQGQPGQQQGFNDRRNFQRDRWGRNRNRGGKYFNNRNGPGFNDGPDQYPENGQSGRGPNPLPNHQANPSVPPEPVIPLPPGPHLDITEVQARPPKVLKEVAKEYNIENPTSYKRHDLICEIMKRNGAKNGSASSSGVLELEREGFGFLRSPRFNYVPCPEDPYVSVAQIRRHNLRRGEFIQGPVRIPRDKERYFALAKLDQIEGKVAEEGRIRPAFDSLTAMFPNRRIFLEGAKGDVSMRAMDLICPLGFGQRGLIVAPPRTGKTILLQKIANAVMENNPQAHLMMILIDERPEEVTDMLRTVKGEVLASTFDETADRHIHVAELAFERAKRLVENKVDVVILMDSITRLTRAYNAMEGNSGKIGTGGIVPNALQRAKRLFGIARNIQEGGSLTIIATALVDTGSRMDDIVFEEFKGTGNMEVNLDRNLSDQRVFPAFNIQRSGTRKEELLYHPDELARIHALRRVLAEESPIEAMTLLLEKINKTQNNIEFLMSLKPT